MQAVNRLKRILEGSESSTEEKLRAMRDALKAMKKKDEGDTSYLEGADDAVDVLWERIGEKLDPIPDIGIITMGKQLVDDDPGDEFLKAITDDSSRFLRSLASVALAEILRRRFATRKKNSSDESAKQSPAPGTGAAPEETKAPGWEESPVHSKDKPQAEGP